MAQSTENGTVYRRCWVSGRVQGVFYRASAAARARELGVTGYARNLPDGRVEVLVCGPAPVVQALIDWLWLGPPAAKVTAVTVEAAPVSEVPAAFTTS